MLARVLPGLALASADICPAAWEFMGPAGYADDGNGPGTYFSATNAVVEGDKGAWFVGTTNGGVWRTYNLYANDSKPDWKPVTDGQPVPCSAISTMGVADYNKSFVAAGCGGATSGMMQRNWNVVNSGDWGGLLLSVDNGDSWRAVPGFENYYLTAVLMPTPDLMVVSARSNAMDPNKGGIWVSANMGSTWKQTSTQAIYHMIHSEGKIYASVALDVQTVIMSSDSGDTWTSISTGLSWDGRLPQISQLAISTAGPHPVLFLGAFSLGSANATDIDSKLFYAELDGNVDWTEIRNAPYMLDPDHMAKDRLTILADPEDATILYLAGNAAGRGPCKGGSCTSVFKIDWKAQTWTPLAGQDTTKDNTSPHPDCRAMAWDASTGNLLLAQDGGLAVRLSPRDTNGTWMGLGGNIGAMEMVYAHWDSRLERFIGGAQDNDVQVTRPLKEGNMVADGFLGCDGMRTAADNMNCPSRLYSSCQNLAGFTMFSDSPLKSTPIDVTLWFPHPNAFLLMVAPYSLNTQKPGTMALWVNGTDKNPSGLWEYELPSPDVKELQVPVDDLPSFDPDRGNDDDDEEEDKQKEERRAEKLRSLSKPVKLVDVSEPIYEVVAGGYTDGMSDPTLLIGLSYNTLVSRRGGAKNITKYSLPQSFAQPVVFDIVNHQQILGPLTHGKTVSLAVSPSDSSVVAVCGWPEDMQLGEEHIWLSNDGGASWKDIIGDLAKATGTIYKVRASGILVVEFSDLKLNAILVGTVSGVFITWSDKLGMWSRVGQLSDLPLVVTDSLTYEHYSDVLTAATYGRGVYILRDAKTNLLLQRNQQTAGKCNVPIPPAPASSAGFFPAQLPCK